MCARLLILQPLAVGDAAVRAVRIATVPATAVILAVIGLSDDTLLAKPILLQAVQGTARKEPDRLPSQVLLDTRLELSMGELLIAELVHMALRAPRLQVAAEVLNTTDLLEVTPRLLETWLGVTGEKLSARL